MTRFILLTFGFLGWAWYEMSGGSEFEPGPISVAQNIETSPLDDVARTDTSAVSLTGLTAPADTGTEAVIAEAASEAEVAKVIEEAVAAVTQPEPSVDAEKSDVLVASLDSRVTITTPALSNGTGSAIIRSRRETAAAEANRDIRAVSGSRVNMRAGPGTNYGVVTRLRKGDEVAVIDDNGNGWLKIRTMDGDELGWMADFLLTASN